MQSIYVSTTSTTEKHDDADDDDVDNDRADADNDDDDIADSVSALNTEEASIKTSCDRFDDQQLKIKSTSASHIIFEKVLSANTVISLKYIAESDSLVLTQTGGGDNNLIFAGIRK